MNDEELEVPKQSKGDIAHSLAKAGLSSIPVIGGAAVELFQNVVRPPLEKRRAEWMERVSEKLLEMEKSGLSLEDLRDNEQFISAVMYASQLALRTHEQEKLNALQNAIANIAIGQAPEEAMQHIFLNLIDSLTELHIQILKFFQAPIVPNGLGSGGLSTVLVKSFPSLHGKRGLYDQLWKDLFTRGLVTIENLHTTMTGSGLAQKRTTDLADDFLNFISSSNEE